MEPRHRVHLNVATKNELGQTAARFDPALHVFDATTRVDGLREALVAHGPPLDGGTQGQQVY